MKPASPALQALLASGAFVMADLYTITLAGGTVLRYTTADLDIASGGDVWTSRGPRIDRASGRARVHWKVGLDVDTLELTVMPQPGDLVGSQPFLAALRAGMLDGAELQLDRAFLPDWSLPLQITGTVTLFAGRIAEVDAGRSAATLKVNSHLELLGVELPRNLYGPGCRHTLFDAGCALSAASFAAAGAAVTQGPTQASFTSSLTGCPDTYFALGRVVFTGGANSGIARAVLGFTRAGGSFSLMAPLPFAIQGGDSFTAYPGCDKQLATCTAKFNNQANFGGFPFIPVPETAV